MKILYLSRRLNADDGSSVHGREFVTALSELGHEVWTYPEIATYPAWAPAQQASEKPVPAVAGRLFRRLTNILKQLSPLVSDFVNIASGYLTAKRSTLELAKIIEKTQPELIIYRFGLFDFTANLLKKKTSLPMVIEVNAIQGVEKDFRSTGSTKWLTRWGESVAYEPADGITVVSRPIQDFLLQTGISKPLAIVENGVNPEIFKPCAVRRDVLRATYGISNRVTLGYIGSYKRWHGLNITVRVLEALLRRGFPVHLVLIGSGPCQAEVDQLKVRLGVEQFITEIPALPHKEVADHLNLIDIALMTYPAIEPFYFSPLKLFEYLASGIPVVASRLGQIEEILSQGRFGKLVEAGHVPGFVAALEPIIDDDELRLKMGAEARAWAEQHCSWHRNADNVLRLAEKVLQHRSKKGQTTGQHST